MALLLFHTIRGCRACSFHDAAGRNLTKTERRDRGFTAEERR